MKIFTGLDNLTFPFLLLPNKVWHCYVMKVRYILTLKNTMIWMSSLAATWFCSIDLDAQKQPAMPPDQNHLELKGRRREREKEEEKRKKSWKKTWKRNRMRRTRKKRKIRNDTRRKTLSADPLWTLSGQCLNLKKFPHFRIFHHLRLNLAWCRLRYDDIFVYWQSPWYTTLTHINHYPYFWMNRLQQFFFLQINQWFYKKRKTYKKEIHWREYKNRGVYDVWHVEHKMEKIHWPLRHTVFPQLLNIPSTFCPIFSVPDTDKYTCGHATIVHVIIVPDTEWQPLDFY